jgi:hypothetical protein
MAGLCRQGDRALPVQVQRFAWAKLGFLRGLFPTYRTENGAKSHEKIA